MQSISIENHFSSFHTFATCCWHPNLQFSTKFPQNELLPPSEGAKFCCYITFFQGEKIGTQKLLANQGTNGFYRTKIKSLIDLIGGISFPVT